MADEKIPEERIPVECVYCSRTTQHRVIHEHETKDTDNDYGFDYGGSYRIIGCMGCQSVSFQHLSWNDNQLDGNYEPIVHETLYPSRTAGRVKVTVRKLPERVQLVYDDTIKAFNVEARLLAAAGLRGVVEAICLDRACGGRNLKDRIDDLVAKGALAKAQADFLHLHRAIGNEAVHEITAPPAEELIAALDIVESVLRNIYELPEIAADLEAARNRRMAKQAPKAT